MLPLSMKRGEVKREVKRKLLWIRETRRGSCMKGVEFGTLFQA